MNAIIESLAPQINLTYAEAATLSANAKDQATAAVEKALECGRLMLKQKESLQRLSGKERCGWIEWLESNCPDISEQTARRYMALAKRSHVSGYFEDFSTLRQAYLATGILKQAPKVEPTPVDAKTPWVRYTRPLDNFRNWYNTRVEDEPLENWDTTLLRLLSNELRWFVNLHSDIQRLREKIQQETEED